MPVTRAGRLILVLSVLALAAHVGGLQGVRLGAHVLRPFGGGWIAAGIAALAAVLVLRARARAPERRVVAAALVTATALALAARIAQDRFDRAAPRLVAEVTHLSEPAGAPEMYELRSLRLPRTAAVRRRFGRTDDLVAVIEATVVVPREGHHRFEIVADDEAELTIDDAPLLSATGRGQDGRWLAAGPHLFRLRYVQLRGPARLEVSWDRPAFVELFPLEQHLVTRGAAPRIPTAALLLALAAKLGAGAALLALLLRTAESGRELARSASVRLSRATVFRPTATGAGAAAIATLALVTLGALEWALRPRSPDGFYFHPFTSEYVMQTVSVADLRLEPLRSLWFLHIQPPAFDALRALLAATFSGADDAELMLHVDRGLYVLWAFVHAGLAGLVAWWVGVAAGRAAGRVAGVLWLLHPAALAYATVLDSTLLSAALFAWYAYELWQWNDARGSAARLAAATLALFFTRSVFQWPFVLLTAAVMCARRRDLRGVRRFLLIAGLPVALFVAKQYTLFGLTMTSSFGPDSFCKGLGTWCAGRTEVPLPDFPDPSRARVLSRTAKLNGEYNYNQLAFLRRSFSQRREYLDRLRGQPLGKTLSAFAFNAGIYLRPSSRYEPHAIVDRLPWRRVHDTILSGAPLVVLLLGAVLVWARGRSARERVAALALALPVLYVVAATIVLERGENHRYKFFVEPVLFVFLAVQAAAITRRLQSWRADR